MVCGAWYNMICPVCDGVGYIVAHNNNDFKDKDEWNVKFYLGERYRFKICHKCNGKGEI